MVNIRKFLSGIGLLPKPTTEIDTQGELEVLSSDGKLRYHNGTSVSPVVTEAHSATLTNKTIDADSNTVSNIENADIKSGAAIDAAKLADGSVSNTEFQYLDGVTSSIQTQLNAKALATDLTNHINNTTGAHAASAISNTPSGNLAATQVQAALNELQSDIDTRALSSSLTTHTGASSGVHGVTGSVVGTTDTQTLTNKTLTSPIISSISNTGTLTLPTSSDTLVGRATSDTLTNKTISGSSNTITNISLTTAVTGVLPAANVGLARTLNAQTGATYTFVLSDGSGAGANTLVTASNASAQTYTVPPNSSVAFPVGTQIDILQLGAGKVTLAQGAGVTINSKSSNKAISAQYVAVTLVKVATDTWNLIGDLIA